MQMRGDCLSDIFLMEVIQGWMGGGNAKGWDLKILTK